MAAPDGAFDGDFSGLDLAISSQSGTEAPIDVVDIALTFADPTAIASIVGLWRGDKGITTGLDPSRVGSWANQVTAGAALAPAVSSSQPVYANDDETHLDLVLGDGAASELTATAASLAGDGARTIVVAFRAWKTDQRGILAMVTNTVAGGTVALELGADGVLKVTACGSTLTTTVALDVEWHVAVIKIASSVAGSSLVSTISLEVDDQQIALTLQSGGGTWASMALATKFGVLGLAADLEHLRAGSDRRRAGVLVLALDHRHGDRRLVLQAVAATAALTTGDIMADGKLRVRAVTGVLVQNLEALEAGARRYVGRSVKPPAPPQEPAKKVEYLPAGDPVVVDDLYPIGTRSPRSPTAPSTARRSATARSSLRTRRRPRSSASSSSRPRRP